ncbi:migration and invasion-inhibitory protein isoform 4-T4 [Molossus nigricans]
MGWGRGEGLGRAPRMCPHGGFGGRGGKDGFYTACSRAPRRPPTPDVGESQVAELGLELNPEGSLQPRSERHRCGKPDDTPGMVETKDLAQLRQLNLELLRQLWVRQDAMRRSVAKAALESSLDFSSSHDSEMPSSQKTSPVVPRASSPQDANQGDSCDTSSPGGASSGSVSLPPAKCQYQESLSRQRPCLPPLLSTSDSSDPERPAELEAHAPRFILDQQSKPSKMGIPRRRGHTYSQSHLEMSGGHMLYISAPEPSAKPWGPCQCPSVTFDKESPVPERSWRFRPYLGYDWIAESLDNSSPISSKPEAFFLQLQEFREANKEDCIHSEPGPQWPDPRESDGAQKDHECVYCYRVNRRLFLVPSDPGTPCRLCRTPRDQQGPETLAEPAQVRVSVPLSILDPPHRHRIHRRKSFDASDTLALPRHCLLGWDILPPKSEKSSAPKSLDLWSCVTSEAQPRKHSADLSHTALPMRVPPPICSEPPVPPAEARGSATWRKTVPLPSPLAFPSGVPTREDPCSEPPVPPAEARGSATWRKTVPLPSPLAFPSGVPTREDPCLASAGGGLRPHPPRSGR